MSDRQHRVLFTDGELEALTKTLRMVKQLGLGHVTFDVRDLERAQRKLAAAGKDSE